MDDWFYYDAVHALHRYCNPVSEPAVRELEAVLDLEPGHRVLDIACGHASLLLGLAARFGTVGVGVDASPFALGRAEAARDELDKDVDVTFVHGRGEDFAADAEFDVAMCIGASWIWRGYAGTLRALRGFVRPGGLIVAGEPYWKADPPDSYLEAESLRRDEFPTLPAYHAFAVGEGLSLVWMRGSSQQEWDRYEMLQTASFDHFLRAHPDHPELEAIRRRLMPSKEAYLAWGREGLGFAVWVWRVPPA